VRRLAQAVLAAGLAAAGWLTWRAGGLEALAWLVLLSATAVAVCTLAYCHAVRQHCTRHCTGTVRGTVGGWGGTVDGTVGGTVTRLPPPTVRALSDSAAVPPTRLTGGSRG
jgi:hypothetical protein